MNALHKGITVYIDTLNLYHCCVAEYHHRVDYRLLQGYIQDTYSPTEIRAYCGFKSRANDTQAEEGFMGVLRLLQNLGWGVMYRVADAYISRISWISQITLDSAFDRNEHHVFFTADTDLIALYTFLTKARGVKVTVCAPRIVLPI